MHGYSNVPQIPVEFHPVLAQMVVVQLLQAFGDNNKTQVAIAILNEKKSEAMKLVKTRYENSPKTITPSGLQGVF